MKVTGSSIEQLEKSKPRGKCRKWRLWASTEAGRKSRRFTGTWTQATEALAAFVDELSGMVENAETFAAYAESWRAWRASTAGLDVQTLTNDERNVRTLCRVFGGLRMDAITPEVVKDGLLTLKNGGSASGKTLGGTYLNNLFVALNNIMSTAADDGRIAANPCAKVKAPKPDTAERRALTIEQMDVVWSNMEPIAAGGDGRAMAMLLILDAGLRPQEALALLPADVDVDSMRLHVRTGMKERTGEIGKTKRPSSVRDLPMTDRLAAVCAAYGSMRVGGKCFCENTRDGSPLRMQNVRKWWEKHREEFGAGDLVPYELRHSNLTKMARYMTIFDLKDWAGWKTIEPAKVYVHRDESAMEAAVRRSQIGTAAGSPAPFLHQKQNRPDDLAV